VCVQGEITHVLVVHATTAAFHADYLHAVNCEKRSLRNTQEVALAGCFGAVPGRMRFYEELTSNQLRMELEKRAIKEYPSDKKGRLAALKGVCVGCKESLQC